MFGSYREKFLKIHTAANIGKMFTSKNLKKLESELCSVVAKLSSKADPCHDLQHAVRVWRIAKKIAVSEGGDLEVLCAASLLHDSTISIVGYKHHVSNKAMECIEKILEDIGFPDFKRGMVIYCIKNHEWYSFGGTGRKPDMLEAAILCDADRIDAIGAIGVVRAAAFAGYNRIPLFPENLYATKSHEIYVVGMLKGKSMLQHFFDKLLKLPSELYTEEAKKIAKKRTEFMIDFIKQLFSELHETK